MRTALTLVSALFLSTCFVSGVARADHREAPGILEPIPPSNVDDHASLRNGTTCDLGDDANNIDTTVLSIRYRHTDVLIEQDPEEDGPGEAWARNCDIIAKHKPQPV